MLILWVWWFLWFNALAQKATYVGCEIRFWGFLFNSAGDCWRYLQGVLQSGISWWFKLYSTPLMKHNFDIERPLIHTTSILRMWLSFDFEQGDYEMESGRLPLPIMNRFHQDEKALHQVCFSRCCCRCCPWCCWCCYNCSCFHPTKYESIWWGRLYYCDVSTFWFNIAWLPPAPP